ncbi:MAG: RhuM family protein [Deltaproteobacteria bacterium]|nr:RhuM family protein [Deltaproteobacteria bacterium]
MRINKEMNRGQIIFYKNNVEVRLDKETVWLSLKQMAYLFGRDKSAISRHLSNVFKEKELIKNSVVANFATTAADGKTYQVEYFNLDVIISVGYRVNSKQGTQFRIWATNVLRKHLVDGYTINEKRLKAQTDKIRQLQNAVRLLGNVALSDGVSDEAKGIIQIITDYSRALDILDDFDHERLSVPKGTKQTKFKITYEEAKIIIATMRNKFRDSALVGQEKDASFRSSIGTIYQTFGGKDVYPTVEEKAAHLLYFVTKNHSFVDGNKRIAAALFICFLQKNDLLIRADGSRRIDDNALVALTLMIAASKAADKDIMIKVLLNLLA